MTDRTHPNSGMVYALRTALIEERSAARWAASVHEALLATAEESRTASQALLAAQAKTLKGQAIPIDPSWVEPFSAAQEAQERLYAAIDSARAVLDKWAQPDGEHTNAELRQMLDECYEGKKKCYFALGQHQTAIDNLIKERDALKAAHSGEPVALTLASHDAGEAGCCMFSRFVPGGTQLYTAPQPVERKPLTPEQREAMWETCKYDDGEEWTVDWERIVDAVEAAHGIKGGQYVDE